MIFDAILMPQPSVLETLEGIPFLHQQESRLLLVIAISMIVIAALSGIFAYSQAYLTSAVGQRVVAEIRQTLYVHIQSLSQSFHESNATGDLLARLTGDIRMLRELLVNSVIYLCDRSVMIMAMLGMMLWMDWVLALVATTIVPALFLTIGQFSSGIKGATRKQRRRESQITHAMHEKLSSIKLVQAFAREAYEEEQFARFNKKSLQAGLRATRLEAKMNKIVQLILACGTAVVAWFGVSRVQAGYLTPGDLLVFTLYLKALYKPINKLSALTGRMAKATVCGERVLAILETSGDIQDPPDAKPAPPFNGALEFRQVSFGYTADTEVFSDANLIIQPQEKIAFIGTSGAGKSSIANLLFRFYDPYKGQILIDGTDIREYQLASLRRQIAVVLQDCLLFNETIRNNIGYGDLNATDEQIIDAAVLAGAHKFIVKLPNAYDTVLSERGDSLSGGQRQRIAIARALIQRSPIVVLDEPTANLDPVNRKKVNAHLRILAQGSTCLLITHDWQQACLADRIIHVEQGNFREISKDELIKLHRQRSSRRSRPVARLVKPEAIGYP